MHSTVHRFISLSYGQLRCLISPVWVRDYRTREKEETRKREKEKTNALCSLVTTTIGIIYRHVSPRKISNSVLAKSSPFSTFSRVLTSNRRTCAFEYSGFNKRGRSTTIIRIRETDLCGCSVNRASFRTRVD